MESPRIESPEVNTHYDPSVDSMLVQFYDIQPGDAVKTIKVNDDVNLDFDTEGRLIQIEIHDASHKLPKPFLQNAGVEVK